jgi:hypothetical protein
VIGAGIGAAGGAARGAGVIAAGGTALASGAPVIVARALPGLEERPAVHQEIHRDIRNTIFSTSHVATGQKVCIRLCKMQGFLRIGALGGGSVPGAQEGRPRLAARTVPVGAVSM